MSDRVKFAFVDHGNASYYGMGPWVIVEEREHTVIMEPVPGGFAYTQNITVYKDTIHDLFVPQEA